jgi:hypothetical protein
MARAASAISGLLKGAFRLVIPFGTAAGALETRRGTRGKQTPQQDKAADFEKTYRVAASTLNRVSW